MTARFEDRVALVTGATSGIGRATAVLLAQEGAIVCSTGRRAVELDKLVQETQGEPGRILPFPGDLVDPEFRARLVEFTLGQGAGGLDLLVNAGGIIGSGSIETTTLESFDRMLDINLRSVFHLTQLAVPGLKLRKGAIVNVSSVTGTRAFPGVLSYCVSKAGVDQFTRCVALELASDGVRVNAVNPGVVRTNLHRAGGMAEPDYLDFLERSRQTHPLGRFGEAEEVAELIAFLGSDAAGWITGETIAIDGGRAQTCAR
jgi:NAD(P)-dependent dehydrogenase (short-subunit alcohol dehydrogenase family)